MRQVFEIVAPSEPAFVFTSAAIMLLMAGLLAVFAYIFFASAHAMVEVDGETLAIRSAMYGRRIPIRDLIVEDAAIVDLKSDRQNGLAWRTNGIGMPGYSPAGSRRIAVRKPLRS
jgi:hypothetical protein